MITLMVLMMKKDYPHISFAAILKGPLQRLQTDHIELYQMHHIDRSTSWEELWGLSSWL